MLTKRVLILANNPLSDGNSNGRTLKNFFDKSDKEQLAQIYIQGGDPDFEACDRFFAVSDGAVLRAFLKRTTAGHEVFPCETSTSFSNSAKGRKIKKTPLSALLRDFFWNRKGWRRAVNEWIDRFSPEAVLLQAGDSPFMYRWAVRIAEERNVPLVIYNSEDYYFKKFDFMRSRGIARIFFPAFRRKLRRAVRNAVESAAVSIYITEDLKNTYDAEFAKPSEYIYTATEVKPNVDARTEGVFSYLGNLGINRHKSLIKIAEALARIDSEYKLDIYGKCPNDEVQASFDACEAIRYHGLVEYSTVRRVMAESTLLFHAESFEPFYRKDIRHGFSTKIADSLASGSPFVLFAPPELSCTKYLRANACAYVIDNEVELEPKLREIIENSELRMAVTVRAVAVAAENHNAEKNRVKMAKILNEL